MGARDAEVGEMLAILKEGEVEAKEKKKKKRCFQNVKRVNLKVYLSSP